MSDYDYEAEIETEDYTVRFRGNRAPLVSAQIARIPAIVEKEHRLRKTDLCREDWEEMMEEHEDE